MFYNVDTFIDGVWCSGSTWASDSHGVSSILTTPAKFAIAQNLFSVLFVFHCVWEITPTRKDDTWKTVFKLLPFVIPNAVGKSTYYLPCKSFQGRRGGISALH